MHVVEKTYRRVPTPLRSTAPFSDLCQNYLRISHDTRSCSGGGRGNQLLIDVTTPMLTTPIPVSVKTMPPWLVLAQRGHSLRPPRPKVTSVLSRVKPEDRNIPVPATKTHSFYTSLYPAIQRQKRLPSCWFGALTAHLPKHVFLGGVFFHRHRYLKSVSEEAITPCIGQQLLAD